MLPIRRHSLTQGLDPHCVGASYGLTDSCVNCSRMFLMWLEKLKECIRFVESLRQALNLIILCVSNAGASLKAVANGHLPAIMSEIGNQFSFSRVASITRRRGIKQIPISSFGLVLFSLARCPGSIFCPPKYGYPVYPLPLFNHPFVFAQAGSKNLSVTQAAPPCRLPADFD
jgi:hypothetical protein